METFVSCTSFTSTAIRLVCCTSHIRRALVYGRHTIVQSGTMPVGSSNQTCVGCNDTTAQSFVKCMHAISCRLDCLLATLGTERLDPMHRDCFKCGNKAGMMLDFALADGDPASDCLWQDEMKAGDRHVQPGSPRLAGQWLWQPNRDHITASEAACNHIPPLQISMTSDSGCESRRRRTSCALRF